MTPVGEELGGAGTVVEGVSQALKHRLSVSLGKNKKVFKHLYDKKPNFTLYKQRYAGNEQLYVFRTYWQNL